ncbi:MAG TPA: hypothetical protein VGQ03_05945 [Nitrososphaera sp.]|nr:hypothetical protein [Nitrososphaera sp.]
MFLLSCGLVTSTYSVVAFAQYGVEGNPSTEPTPEQLAECERLGIEPGICTENTILAKQRLIGATPDQTTVYEGIVLTAVSVGNQTGNHFDARILWTPADLGEPNKFHIEIFDAKQLEPRSALAVRYDIRIYQGDKYLKPLEPTGNEAVQNEDFSHDYTFIFLKGGSYVLAIEEIEHEGENITIPIQVTPEFPPAIVPLLVTGAGLTIAAIYSSQRMT